ncbi:MAG: AI-2E family transporter, partial [Paracoccaceae bacterium]|nr:AI-2E family transporter [Paracoccaceae bacterium]
AAGAVYWAMLTFFLLRDRAMLSRWLMSLVVGSSARRAIGRAMRDVRTDVARYFLAITMINLGLGVCTAAAFQLLGIENAPLWGVAATLLNFMPFLGAAIMALITLGVGMVSFADPVIAFAPFAVVVALNTIEGHVVTPMVVGARVQLPPITIFVAIAFGAWLWGAAGALVATPTLIFAIAFVRRLNAASRLPSRSPRQRKRR